MNIPSQPAPTFPPPAPTAPPAVPVDQLVDAYRQMRDAVKALKERHSAELEPYNTRMSLIEQRLLAMLNESHLESVKTGAGTAYKSTTTSYTVDDPTAFRAYVDANGLQDLYENRVSKTVLESMIAEGRPMPPGIKVSSFTRINIRG